MDLSGLIFVALFVGWAVYLIPKFMRDHEQLATTRSLQDFSARVRVFAATRTVSKQNLLGPDEPTVEISMDEVREALAADPKGRRARPLPTRAAAKRAAKRRRRVLALLLVLTSIVAGLAVAHIGPIWTPAIPGALALMFLLSARGSARRMKAARRAARPRPSAERMPEAREESARVVGEIPPPVVVLESDVEVEMIASVEAANAADNHAAAAADRLWDPVPITLPTYVDKPAARRTVMSIELNKGMVSSGHNAADSELVRAAEAADETPVDLEAPRRAAGA